MVVGTHRDRPEKWPSCPFETPQVRSNSTVADNLRNVGRSESRVSYYRSATNRVAALTNRDAKRKYNNPRPSFLKLLCIITSRSYPEGLKEQRKDTIVKTRSTEANKN
ncbi:unnamed protein product [Ixodes pacificus]